MEDIKENDKKKYKNILDSHYFDLIKYLISYGLLDRTYTEYLSYFHEGIITIEDNMFLGSVMQNSVLSEAHRLKEKATLIRMINPDEFYRESVLNYDLLEELLNNSSLNKRDEKFSNMMNILDVHNRTKFLDGFFAYKIPDIMLPGATDLMSNYIELILINLPEKLTELTVNMGFSDLHKKYLFSILMRDIEISQLIGSDVKKFIPKLYKILEVHHIEDWTQIFEKIAKVRSKYVCLKNVKASESVWIQLENTNIYELSYMNSIAFINALEPELTNYADSMHFTVLRKSVKLKNLYSNIKDNMSEYVEQYITATYEKGIKLINSEEDTVDIYNAINEVDIQFAFLDINETIIRDLSVIEDDAMKRNIFLSGLSDSSFENALEYFMTDECIDITHIVSIINAMDIFDLQDEIDNFNSKYRKRNIKSKHIDQIESEMDYRDECRERLITQLVQENSLEINSQRKLIGVLKYKINKLNSKIDEEHVTGLIENDKIEFNRRNIEIIMSFNSQAPIYIEKNIDKYVSMVKQGGNNHFVTKEILTALINRKLTEKNILWI